MKNGFDTGSTKKDSTFCKNNHSKKGTGSIFKMASNIVTCSDLPSATVQFENLFYDVQVDSDAQFAAVLTAKLYNLDIVRGSPDPLEEYENPSSMETQVGSVERTRKATVPGTHNTGQR
jgi:hypothetical protein